MNPILGRFFRQQRSTVGKAASLAEAPHNPHHDISMTDLEVIDAVAPYTMTSVERRHHLLQSVRYIVRNRIQGTFVECGVWRGGSMMLAATALLQASVTNREFYLFDTFEGMPAPGPLDVHPSGRTADELLKMDHDAKSTSHIWAIATEADVRANLATTKYPGHRFNLVKGRVEDTIPSMAPESIALLRLDTDWYESTKHELAQLYHRVSHGGVVIIDDYGWWRGSRAATDEFVARCPDPILLHRLDSGGGYAFVKLAGGNGPSCEP